MSELTEQFPHTCTIQRRTAGAADEVGEASYTYPTLATGVACHFQDKGSTILAGKQNIELENPIAFFQYTQGIEEGDRIINVATNAVVQFAGPYTVTGIKEAPPLNDEDIGHKQVDLEQID